MEFSSWYWDYFHYSDSRGYLIFCCHGVASKLRMIYTLQTDYIIRWILHQSILIIDIVAHDPNLFERDQLFDLIVPTSVESQKLLNNFFVGPKPDFKELFSHLIDDRRFEPTP